LKNYKKKRGGIQEFGNADVEEIEDKLVEEREIRGGFLT